MIFHEIKIERQKRALNEDAVWMGVKMSLTITTSLKIFVCEWNLNIKKEPRRKGIIFKKTNRKKGERCFFLFSSSFFAQDFSDFVECQAKLKTRYSANLVML